MCAAGDTWDRIAFVDGEGGVSLGGYDPKTKQLVIQQTADLSKLLSDKSGTPLAVSFAGKYLRIATTRYSLIELDWAGGK